MRPNRFSIYSNRSGHTALCFSNHLFVSVSCCPIMREILIFYFNLEDMVAPYNMTYANNILRLPFRLGYTFFLN